MIKVLIFLVVALGSVGSEEKVMKILDNSNTVGLIPQESNYFYINTPQEIQFKSEFQLPYNQGKYNILNQESTISLQNRQPDILAKCGSYAQHNYGYTSRSNNDYLNPSILYPSPPVKKNSNFYNDFKHQEVTNNIPSIKVDQPYYRTLPNRLYYNQEISAGYANPKLAPKIKGIASKHVCIECNSLSHHKQYPLQSAVHYQHEKLDMEKAFGKKTFEQKLPRYINQKYNYDYSHQDNSGYIEKEKQRILYKINYSSNYGRNSDSLIPLQNNYAPREPFFKSNPHYLKYKPYFSVDTYNKYRLTTDGLLEHGPKYAEYNPVTVKDHYNYNYKYENYSPPCYIDPYYFADLQNDLLYSVDNYYYNFNSTISDYTNAKNISDGKVYYNPYFDFIEPNNVSYDDTRIQQHNYTQLKDLLQVLQHLGNSMNKYNSELKNLYDNKYTPQNDIYLKNVAEGVNEMLHIKSNPYGIAYNNDIYQHENDNYASLKNFKEGFEELKLYTNEEVEHNTNVHTNYIYTDPDDKNVQNDNSIKYYRHFKDVVEEVTKLYSKNKHSPYLQTNDYYQSIPFSRQYLHDTIDGLLNPYKIRSSPYILPEYKRYSPQYL